MPYICTNCRSYFYRSGHFDGRTENKYLVGAGVSSYIGAAGCIAGTAALYESDLALSAFASVCIGAGAGICIGSALAVGSLCIACGCEGYQESCTTVSSLHPPQSSLRNTVNPLARITPPHQGQMSDTPPTLERSQTPSPHHGQQSFGQQHIFTQNTIAPYDRQLRHNLAPQQPQRIQTLSPLPPPQLPNRPNRSHSLSPINSSNHNTNTPSQQRPRSYSAPLIK